MPDEPGLAAAALDARRRKSPSEHAKAIIDNYTRNKLGDPKQSDDHAVAVSVAYLDLLEHLQRFTRGAAAELNDETQGTSETLGKIDMRLNDLVAFVCAAG
jgi:predicted ATP-dependent protease